MLCTPAALAPLDTNCGAVVSWVLTSNLGIVDRPSSSLSVSSLGLARDEEDWVTEPIASDDSSEFSLASS